ncbi:uncharacterized protein LOC129583073 [Paramacrobiotus metropolitanus]|uniref:uncharacterized protein LOC129583073 n=1 Tax=Paramacrobiotus metropolitanus TaxID=2943436 RepID=UPI002446517B|nr:uncharacterized protein LOC129583073 [Paramacrobiotus metropolitanus]XP_055330754.1 uncharacterized protein LOC129583073 [Paramacrobiotus metropolitanus]
MGFKKSFTFSVNKELFSSYPEILTESVVVLWFACEICMKFGLRVLPDWRTSRLDPDHYNSFDSLLELSGLKVNACFWDDVMSGWMQPHPVTINQSAGLVVVPPSSSNVLLAYVATVTTILLTAFLGISFCYLVYENRDRTIPLPKDHLLRCRGLAALGRYKFIQAAVKIPLPLPAYIFAVLVGWLTVVISSVIHYAFWMVVEVLPVVVLAWMSVIMAMTVFGPSTVFPGCILFASILIMYCAGRIWGLWMNETYHALTIKKIRKLIAAKSSVKPTLSIITSPGKPIVVAGTDPYYEAWKISVCYFLVFCSGCLAAYYNVWPLCRKFPTVSRWQSNKDSANWTYWQVVNLTGTCSKHGTGFDQGIAMLSYWVDLQSEELQSAHTGNSDLLASFTPSYPRVVSWIFLVWSGALSGASGLPYAVLRYAKGIFVGLFVLIVGGLLVHGGVLVYYNKWRRCALVQRSVVADDSDEPLLVPANVAAEESGLMNDAPSDRVPLLADVKTDVTCIVLSDHLQDPATNDHVIPEAKDEHGAQVAIECTPMAAPQNTVATGPFCVCEQLSTIWLFVVVAHCPVVCGVLLPYSVVGLFLWEELQLPALLLLLTAYTVWVYRRLVMLVWLMWYGEEIIRKEYEVRCGLRCACCGEMIPADELEERLVEPLLTK